MPDLSDTTKTLISQDTKVSVLLKLPIGEWSFDDIVEWSSFTMQTGLIKGMSVRDSAWRVCEMTSRWRAEKSKIEAGQKSTKIM